MLQKVKNLINKILRRTKNLLKKIVPPSINIFHRENNRVLDAIAALRRENAGKQQQLLSEIAALKKQQQQMHQDLRKELLAELQKELPNKFQKEIQKETLLVQEQVASALKNLKAENQELKKCLAEMQEKHNQSELAINREILENRQVLSGEVRREGHGVRQKIERIRREDKNLPLISVLIPVYNVEDYLRECLDSVVSQQMENIEIICVNDGSTDGSGDILEEYAAKDSRIKVISKEKNEGLLLARKTAVEAARGEYLLFVDSDDCIDQRLCNFAEEVTKREYADIIQFGAGVCDYSNNENKLAWLQRALMPVDREWENGDVLKQAYVNRSHVTTMWGKLYKAELCKKAYADLPDTHCYVGEDIFTYFFLAHYAQYYKGIPTPEYYTYRHGLGVTNAEEMPLEKFELYCRMANFHRYTYDKLVRESQDPALQESYAGMVRRIATDCCNIYASRIREEDKEAALKMLVSYWGDSPIADEAAQKILGISLSQTQES